MSRRTNLITAAVRQALNQPALPAGAPHAALATLGLGAILAFTGPLAAAAQFTVTNTNDSGPGSLRQAILDAQAQPDADEILFASTVTGAIKLTGGPLLIDRHRVSITGPGASILTLDGNGDDVLRARGALPGRDDLYDRDHPGTDVTISGVTISHGRRGIETAGPYSVDLTIADCVITENAETGVQVKEESQYGPGVHVIRISDTTIAGNGLDGIAIDAHWAEYGSVQMDRVAVVDNGRRGIYSDSLDLQVSNSRISGNAEGIVLNGKARYYLATMVLADSVVSGNQGAGIFADEGRLKLLRSTVSDNGGSGIGSRLAPFNATVIGSTIASNVGGGIDVVGHFPYYGGTTILLDNATISGNLNRPGIMLGAAPTSVKILHSTIADHPAGAIATADGITAGPRAAYPVEIIGSIIAGSGAIPDISGPAAIAVQYSLIRNVGAAAIHDNGSSVFGVSPKLAPLADNGGPTLTRALLPGSPAIDRGDPAFAAPPITDQRGGGFVRVANRIDLGAVEVQGAGGSGAAALLEVADSAIVGGLPWVVVIDKPNDAAPARVTSRDSETGALIGRFDLSTGARPIAVVVLPDFAGSPAPDLVVLGDDGLAELRDLQSGAWINTVGFAADLAPIDLVALPNLYGGSYPHLAMLGGGGNRVEIRHGRSRDGAGSFVYKLAYSADLQLKDLLVTDDLNGDGRPDLAVLGASRTPGGRDTIDLRDPDSGGVARPISLGMIDLGRSHTVHELAAVGDGDGDGVSEIATLRSNAAGVNVVIHNPDTTGEIATLYFRKAFQPLGLIPPGDANGNGWPDLGLIGRNTASGDLRIDVKDSATGDVVIRSWINKDLRLQDTAVLEDIDGNGNSAVAVLGRRPSNDRLTVVIKDGATGDTIRQFSF